MNENLYRWRNRQLREHVSVVENQLAPTKLLKNATYLNVYMREWERANIWIYEDRIVYVGDRLPEVQSSTEVVDCTDYFLVPGYVEPHAHPFQLYNPQTLAEYAVTRGTTTLVNDNLILFLLLRNKKAFSFLDEMQCHPASIFWWARFDSQSELRDEDERVDEAAVLEWLNHDAVIQGGELTSWPDILKDDERGLHWMQETRRLRKVVEGHFPGASENTLTKMKLLGTDGDHESISGEDVLKRIRIGYYAGLRNSSIRSDLSEIIKSLLSHEIKNWDYLFYTTDGSTPSFYKSGVIEPLIQIALELGVPVVDAYRMATINPATYFGLRERIGSIAPGRVAHINFLSEQTNPFPEAVLAKGKWTRYKNQPVHEESKQVDFEKTDLKPLNIVWELKEADFTFSTPIGMEMQNDVILKPYPVKLESHTDQLSETHDEAFALLLDREGKWRISSYIKGFTTQLGGMVSTYSNTGDFILIGKRKGDMKLAFNRMKEMGGGIVLAHQGKIIYELPLPLKGAMTDISMEKLIGQEEKLQQVLIDFGYRFQDPVYTLLFLSSTHLPYIRLTPKGLMDVKKKEILFPSVMR
ncbi:adenine deaminase C-terminal domain-containing protein [Halalkalibacillus halophilus]|uniref:adenine deaminase C-terminal domain-containing protein n=1 Tax=Halalkalibacillus halophilus TaxID=392827 RepID=UPI000483505D|nr:adenine deaminase C-terminal domain-containing protein [Halalkalibacillus halophilus]